MRWLTTLCHMLCFLSPLLTAIVLVEKRPWWPMSMGRIRNRSVHKHMRANLPSLKLGHGQRESNVSVSKNRHPAIAQDMMDFDIVADLQSSLMTS